MEILNVEDKKESKLCKKWLVIERCAGCVFETLCWYEDQKKKREEESEKNSEK
jgi:hypothetical protein